MNYYSILGLSSAYLFFFIFERIYPLRSKKQSSVNRLVTNLIMTLLVIVIANLTVVPVVKWVLNLNQTHRLGLLPWLKLDGVLGASVGFLLLDLSFYYWHLLNHKLSIFWRFHNVHHVDEYLDVTTSMRFHGVEIAYSSAFRLIQLITIGISPLTLIFYEFVFQMATFFHHSNLRLPKRFEKKLNLVFVTPRIHGIHHSNYKNETDSNYGVIFSFWDRVHRTLNQTISQDKITIGVPAYQQKDDNRLRALLIMPFVKQRDYWIDAKNQKHLSRDKIE